MNIAFDAFIRSIAIDYERHRIAVGTSEGFVAVASIRHYLAERLDVDPSEAMFSQGLRPIYHCKSKMAGAPHEAQVLGLAMDGGTGLLVSGDGAPHWRTDLECRQPTLKIWKLAADRDQMSGGDISMRVPSVKGTLVHTLHGHRDSITSVVILGYCPARQDVQAHLHAASASRDGSVYIWRLSDGQRVGKIDAADLDGVEHGTSLCIAPGRQATRLFIGHESGHLLEWDWPTGRVLRSLRLYETPRLLPLGPPTTEECATPVVIHRLYYHHQTDSLSVGLDEGAFRIVQWNTDAQAVGAPREPREVLAFERGPREEAEDISFPHKHIVSLQVIALAVHCFAWLAVVNATTASLRSLVLLCHVQP